MYFSDYFRVSESDLEDYGAFNISLITDLPLFIDPFLLFHSDKEDYKILHDNIIQYLKFLRDKSVSGGISSGHIHSWYKFPEVKQNWFGFSKGGNVGRGLGSKFANALNKNLNRLFNEFGEERVTRGSHLEKLCLIEVGVGKDSISDFTTNLIKGYLLEYTQNFTKEFVNSGLAESFSVKNSYFNYRLERWMPRSYILPIYFDDFIILTPKDILTKDDTWINKTELMNYYDIPDSIDNRSLRASINAYFLRNLPKRPKEKDKEEAWRSTLLKFPEIIDYYIREKEEKGDEARRKCNIIVSDSQRLYISQIKELSDLLFNESEFYQIEAETAEESKKRIEFLKDVIENKGGYRLFYVRGEPVRNENDLQIMYRLTWFATTVDVSREVNNGRGPADFKISHGSFDKTIIEFKLASNPQLKRNIKKQAELYMKASGAETGYKVILYFTEQELKKVEKILLELGLSTNSNIYLIDARKDNKPSASVA